MTTTIDPPALGQHITVKLRGRFFKLDGQVLKIIPANEEMSDADLQLFCSVAPGHKDYPSLKRAAKLPRFVVRKLNTTNHFLLLPMGGLGTHWTFTPLND